MNEIFINRETSIEINKIEQKSKFNNNETNWHVKSMRKNIILSSKLKWISI